jgi:hypothetical protein
MTIALSVEVSVSLQAMSDPVRHRNTIDEIKYMLLMHTIPKKSLNRRFLLGCVLRVFSHC